MPDQFFMTFPLAECIGKSRAAKHEIGSMVQNGTLIQCGSQRERGHMSHIYVILTTPAIRHTGSMCSDCLLSIDEYVMSVL